MTKITMILQEADVARMRKAVCVAGGERLVVMPLFSRLCGVDMMDIQCEKAALELRAPVRMEVVASDEKSGTIMSAIQGVARAGNVILVSARQKFSHWVAKSGRAL